MYFNNINEWVPGHPYGFDQYCSHAFCAIRLLLWNVLQSVLMEEHLELQTIMTNSTDTTGRRREVGSMGTNCMHPRVKVVLSMQCICTADDLPNKRRTRGDQKYFL